MTDRLKAQIGFIMEIDEMKNVLRRNLIKDGSRRENDAEHSWHLAVSAMVLSEYAGEKDTDISHVLKLALVHDLVEVYAGDTFAYDTKGYEDKEQREKDAADKLFSMLPDGQSEEFRALWDEFEENKTNESKFANALDRFMPLLLNYQTKGHTWKLQDNITSESVYKRMEPIKTGMPEVWAVVEEIIEDSIRLGYLKK